MPKFDRVESFKVKDRKIILKNESKTIKIIDDYVIPHGLYFNDNIYDILISRQKIPTIMLSPKDIESNVGISKLYPYFKEIKKVRIKNRSYKAIFWQVVNDRDKFSCEMLIAKFHHQSVPTRGAILACSIPDYRPGIIGCAFLNKMTYTSALNNRVEYLDVEIDKIKKMNRGEIVNDFGISWASRFVVHKDLINFGLGTIIAETLKEMAAKHFVPVSNFIEIYATMPITLYEKYKNDNENKNNFLTTAGYTLNSHYKTSSKFSLKDFDENGYRIIQKGKRLYYYCDVRGKQSRLFVPLNSEAYYWFLDDGKEWEVRNYRGAFTLGNIYIGKKVEIRRGYSDKTSSIWGKIIDIDRFYKIEDMFSKINYKKIIPVAKSVDDAIAYSRKFLKEEKDGKANIIAIKIKI